MRRGGARFTRARGRRTLHTHSWEYIFAVCRVSVSLELLGLAPLDQRFGALRTQKTALGTGGKSCVCVGTRVWYNLSLTTPLTTARACCVCPGPLDHPHHRLPFFVAAGPQHNAFCRGYFYVDFFCCVERGAAVASSSQSWRTEFEEHGEPRLGGKQSKRPTATRTDKKIPAFHIERTQQQRRNRHCSKTQQAGRGEEQQGVTVGCCEAPRGVSRKQEGRGTLFVLKVCRNRWLLRLALRL